MFTGIVEDVGTVTEVICVDGNVKLKINCAFIDELKVDQSISHNGVCLTITEVKDNYYSVTVIEESLRKSNLINLKKGDGVNLERSMKLNGRLDGHMVQGHVDQTAECIKIVEENGSWIFIFSYDKTKNNLTVEKGSVCVNGVSLTVFNSRSGEFSVAIIPYTFENTTFKNLEKGSVVNLEFDIIGKYVQQYLKHQKIIN